MVPKVDDKFIPRKTILTVKLSRYAVLSIKTDCLLMFVSTPILGTHDAQNCTVNQSSRPNTVNVSCAFPETSVALGYLSILRFDNSSREIFVAATRDDMSNSDLNISVSGVPSDNYTVVIFDIGNNGRPLVNNTGGRPYVLAAGIENVTVTDSDSSRDEEESITVIPESK